MQKPNHICKVCGKAYYACDDCDKRKMITWRSVACEPSHYQIFATIISYRDKQITKEQARSFLENINVFPSCIEHFNPDIQRFIREIYDEKPIPFQHQMYEDEDF